MRRPLARTFGEAAPGAGRSPAAPINRRWRHLLAGVAASLAVALAHLPAGADDVVMSVNGDPITSRDIALRSHCTEVATHRKPTCQEAVDLLIDEKLKLQLARRYGLEISAEDADRAFDAMAARMAIPAERLRQILVDVGCSADMLAVVKADFAWRRVLRGWFLPDTGGVRYMRELRRAAVIEKVDQTTPCTAP